VSIFDLIENGSLSLYSRNLISPTEVLGSV